MRRPVEPPAAWQVLLAWLRTESLVPSLGGSKRFVAGPQSARVRRSCPAIEKLSTSPRSQASARSALGCYPASGLAAVGALLSLRLATNRLPWEHTAAKVARLAAQQCIQRVVPPNPSIERTCPGKPGQASHVKR
jgi:hypothetical protein